MKQIIILLSFILIVLAQAKKTYVFDKQVTLEMNSEEEGVHKVKYLVTTSGKYSGVETAKGVVTVTDSKKMVMINSIDKNVMIMPLGGIMASMNKKSDENDFDIKKTGFSKTGKTKMIAGIKCKEYRATFEGKEGSFWFGNPEFELYGPMAIAFKKMTSKIKHLIDENEIMMESSYEENGKRHTSFKIKSISNVKRVINTDGFMVKDMTKLMPNMKNLMKKYSDQ